MGKNIILTYHALSTTPGTAESPFTVSATAFTQHLTLLQKQFCKLHALENPLSLTENTISITFDDGTLSDYTIAKELLLQHHIPATFFIPVNTKQLTWLQIKTLADLNFNIQSHGLNHIGLTLLNKQQQLRELHDSKKTLEDALGKPVTHFAFPYGDYNNKLVALALEAGYTHLYSARASANSSDNTVVKHRMLMKANTSLQAFSRLTTFNSFYLNKSKQYGNLKHAAKQLLGFKFCYGLHKIYHSKQYGSK